MEHEEQLLSYPQEPCNGLCYEPDESAPNHHYSVPSNALPSGPSRSVVVTNLPSDCPSIVPYVTFVMVEIAVKKQTFLTKIQPKTRYSLNKSLHG
jgi:hypothetical protein